MKISRSFLRALNVRRDEWWLVQKLFLLQFFQGAGIAFFFTASFSRFLEHFPVTDLAYVFVLASFLLWTAGFFYGKLEHKVSSFRLSVIITCIVAFSMILFRVGAAFITGNWFYLLMLAWFYVLYLLNNLLFWGMASQLYDVRQSKRLFSVISAGDIPAKFIGYSVAVLIVAYTGTANLLIAGFIFILLSFPFLHQIFKSDKSANNQAAETIKHSSGIQPIINDFSANLLIRRVALLSLIVSACIVLINFGFYSEVKNAYKKDVEFASFIAKFMAVARLIALAIKILFTSRLLYWIGNRAALIIAPIILILLITALLLTNVVTYNSINVLYIFGLAAIVVDVLNSAINSPVLLTLMQPLSTLERLRAHNIVKGIMDPFAYLLSGIFILVFLKLKLFDLQSLSYVLLGLAIAWIIGIFRVHQQYLKTLMKTISSRFFSQEEFNLYDPSARELIEEKINTGSELEVLYILRMLGSRRSAESNRLIIHALHQPSVKVVNEALRIVGELNIKEAEPWLTTIIAQHPVDSIRSEAVKVLAQIAFQESIIVPLMDSDDKLIRRSSIISVLNHCQVAVYTQDAENKIKILLVSKNQAEKKEGVAMLCETVNGNFDTELLQLLNESDKLLRLAAIKAIGYHPSVVCLEQLIKKMNEQESNSIEALIIAKEKALPFIKSRIVSADCRDKQKENLITAIGRIGGKAAHELLLELVKELPAFETFIVKVLHRCHYKAGKHDLKLIEAMIRNQLLTAVAILHMQKKISTQKEEYGVLFNSLQLELHEIRETLLFQFSFIYDREKISKIKAAIEINKKETNANAIELVDMTVKKEFANPFNAAFEYGDLEHRCNLLKSLFPKDLFPDMDAIFSNILTDKNLSYNNWSKACTLYVTKKIDRKPETQLIHKYLDSENLVLKETAGFAIENN